MRPLLLVMLAGCVLGAKVPPLELRHFAPVEDAATPSDDPREGPSLRIGHVVADGHLRHRIAHRESAVELLFYETLRWTERPDEYVRRALVEKLVERHRAQLVVTGDAPVLEVEVSAFEEVRRDARSFGRVQLRYQLDDGSSVLASDVITVERAAASSDITDVVLAIGDAMHAATREVADRTLVVLRAQSLRTPAR